MATNDFDSDTGPGASVTGPGDIFIQAAGPRHHEREPGVRTLA